MPLQETIRGCRAILDGGCDDWREESFYMVGDLDEARAKENAAKEDAAKEDTAKGDRA